jgi:hypothetical protein
MNEYRLLALKNIAVRSCIMVDYILFLAMETFRRARQSKHPKSKYLPNDCLEKNKNQYLLTMKSLSDGFETLDNEHAAENYYGFASWIQSHIFKISVMAMETSYPRLLEDNISAYFSELGWAFRLMKESEQDNAFTSSAEELDKIMESFDEIFDINVKRSCRTKRSELIDIIDRTV